ncbi:hypothetical protein JHJ32_18875 [Parapedobacter sp. ISTM3]|uniref:hypothetical protein n=1 Tax=Parapedobacter sp. ISTM3 TaxID=2800130 RepID=UPI001904A28B|nr:hypothetical protein [Parapedobacter sp. ISTM3]MBK1442068.1 hypothetical protein [Parapedobacter sp. ISTM3]
MNPNKRNEFDKQLQEKFGDFRPEVPVDLWGKIAAQLDAQAQGDAKAAPAKQRRLPVWWLSAAAMLLAVCGVFYWYNRPVAVTYLQRPVAKADPIEPAIGTITQSDKDTVPASEPLDIERLKQVFAKKDRGSVQHTSPTLDSGVNNDRPPVENQGPQQLMANQPIQYEVAGASEVKRPATAVVELPVERPGEQSVAMEEALANVPDIQPLVALEDDEETMLASAGERKQPFGISNILNYVVGTVDQREEKLVTFSNDSEGSLKLDFNFGLAKNKKKKVK